MDGFEGHILLVVIVSYPLSVMKNQAALIMTRLDVVDHAFVWCWKLPG